MPLRKRCSERKGSPPVELKSFVQAYIWWTKQKNYRITVTKIRSRRAPLFFSILFFARISLDTDGFDALGACPPPIPVSTALTAQPIDRAFWSGTTSFPSSVASCNLDDDRSDRWSLHIPSALHSARVSSCRKRLLSALAIGKITLVEDMRREINFSIKKSSYCHWTNFYRTLFLRGTASSHRKEPFFIASILLIIIMRGNYSPFGGDYYLDFFNELWRGFVDSALSEAVWKVC